MIQNTKREINQDGPLGPKACFQRGPLKRALKKVKNKDTFDNNTQLNNK